MKSIINEDFIKVLEYLKVEHGVLNTFAANKAGVTPDRMTNVRRGKSSVEAMHISALLREFMYQLSPVIEELGLVEYMTPEIKAMEINSLEAQLKELNEQMKALNELKGYMKENKLLQQEMKAAIEELKKRE